MSWQKVKLSDVSVMKRGKYVTRSSTRIGNIPVILGGQEPAYYCDESNHDGKCIVISRSGASAGFVSYWDEPIFVTDGFLFEANEKSEIRYLYAYLKSQQHMLGNMQNGTGIPHVRGEDLKNYEISLPPLPIQRKIADVLGAYDELIENKRKRIALLEKMARELYRERFVRRSRKGYPKALANFCTVQYGYAFNSKEFNAGGQGLPIVRIRNIPQGASTDYTTEKAPEEYIVHDGERLVGMDGEFHINLWSGGDAYLVQRSCCFRPYDESVKGFLMEAIRAPIKYFESSAMGATVGHLGKKDIDTISLYEPTDEENALFNEMYKERLSLSLQSRILAKQRDRLLPRLMSGKIDVEKLVKAGK